MIILGLNQYHGDSAAALIVDGRVIAAVEEERFNRLKHWSGFPVESINFCLSFAGISANQIDAVCVNREPRSHRLKKIAYVFHAGMSPNTVLDRLRNRKQFFSLKDDFCNRLSVDPQSIKAQFIPVEHHRAHLASAFLVSPFDRAALLSVDGFGDFTSTMLAEGINTKMSILESIHYPHSLGMYYLALTQFLGFPHYGDEYKVMGLSAYGEPRYADALRKIVDIRSDGTFRLNMSMFTHNKNVEMSWYNTTPSIGCVFSQEMVKLLGPCRASDAPIEQSHKDIAASMQLIYEEGLFALLGRLYRFTDQKNLCLAGGCALNSLANGKIFDRSPFTQVYIPPAAADAGGAIGAALYYYHTILQKARTEHSMSAYIGPHASPDDIAILLKSNQEAIVAEGSTIQLIKDEHTLCETTAQAIADGLVVGWFQGRMEWGPRALGNRSIVCDPRRSDMKQILNAKIKRRESFRPFAPSIQREAVADYFETDYDVPFMMQVFRIRKEKRDAIPAVTHADGTGRLQTVTREQNSRYWNLIEAFRQISGIPMVLNTSFNENEPIVNTPQQALDCFLRTKMDVLVLGDFFMRRTGNAT
jgi:carbamoyltransferase